MGRIIAVLALSLLILFSLAGPALAGSRIIIDKSTNRLHFLRDGQVVQTFPVATGRHPSYTPEGNFTVVVKLVNPYYSRLGIPGGSPANPLGVRWLGLSIGGGGVYGIHGTNNPASIGTYASAGCIRMHNKDVIWLFDRTPLGTPVTITRGSETIPASSAPRTQPMTVVAEGRKITVQALDAGGKEPPVLPLRAVFELLGYSVAWDGGTSSVLVGPAGETAVINCATGRVTAGGTTFHQPGIRITGGSAHGPLALWPRMLPGVETLWNPETRTVTISGQTGAGPPPGPSAPPPGTPAW